MTVLILGCRWFAGGHKNTVRLHFRTRTLAHFGLCEYHVECYWIFWPLFRSAIGGVWPVRTETTAQLVSAYWIHVCVDHKNSTGRTM